MSHFSQELNARESLLISFDTLLCVDETFSSRYPAIKTTKPTKILFFHFMALWDDFGWCRVEMSQFLTIEVGNMAVAVTIG